MGGEKGEVELCLLKGGDAATLAMFVRLEGKPADICLLRCLHHFDREHTRQGVLRPTRREH